MWLLAGFIAALVGCATLIVIALRFVLGDLDDLHDIWLHDDDDDF